MFSEKTSTCPSIESSLLHILIDYNVLLLLLRLVFLFFFLVMLSILVESLFFSFEFFVWSVSSWGSMLFLLIVTVISTFRCVMVFTISVFVETSTTTATTSAATASSFAFSLLFLINYIEVFVIILYLNLGSSSGYSCLSWYFSLMHNNLFLKFLL